MNVYTFIICILLTSVSDYKPVFSRSTYDNPSYNNDRDENLSILSAHQKKRLTNEEALRDEDQAEEYEHNAPLYEAQRYRKYEPENSFRHDNRLEKNRELFDEGKMNSQKRDYYDAATNPKDASIEVILDPRAKKAVAVVENSPSGQAMYDLSGWKNNKDDGSAYESNQYTPGTQEQVVNLVYPAERNERKYSANTFEANSDYSEKSKAGFKDKLIENERAAEDTHKRKRNAEAKNKLEKETEKRSAKEKTKRKSDQKSSSKSNECPPHNTPSTMESDSNKNDNDDKFDKQETVKREAPQWSQAQLNALKNSLAHVNDNSGEVQNLRNILTDMGLINDAEINKKRETAKLDTTSSPTEKLEEDKEKMNNDLKADIEDEDLNQDNIILKRNGREININEEDDMNKAPVELIEKREADENNSEEEENEESFSTKNEKKEIKRSNTESETTNAAAVLEGNEKEVAQLREKRQDTETNKNLNEDKAETAEKSKDTPASDSEMNKNINDNTKIYTKRETNNDNSKERKNRENQENEEEYEKRMESQIQAKIDAIKEKVKREILEEQFKRRYKRNLNAEEASRTNTRKRRQAKEESKAVKDTDNINKENDVASSGDPQAKIVRRKRANTLPEKQMVYRAYQADQDEEADDDGEFDDNAYDGRMYLEKRQAEDENDYYDPVRKREVEGYLQQYYPEPRNRRSFNNDGFAEDSNAFHGSRRALKNKSFAGRENQEEYNAKSNENNDNEYFGSLPQTYNGELTRYKRVKRDNPYK